MRTSEVDLAKDRRWWRQENRGGKSKFTICHNNAARLRRFSIYFGGKFSIGHNAARLCRCAIDFEMCSSFDEWKRRRGK